MTLGLLVIIMATAKAKVAAIGTPIQAHLAFSPLPTCSPSVPSLIETCTSRFLSWLPLRHPPYPMGKIEPFPILFIKILLNVILTITEQCLGIGKD